MNWIFLPHFWRSPFSDPGASLPMPTLSSTTDSPKCQRGKETTPQFPYSFFINTRSQYVHPKSALIVFSFSNKHNLMNNENWRACDVEQGRIHNFSMGKGAKFSDFSHEHKRNTEMTQPLAPVSILLLHNYSYYFHSSLCYISHKRMKLILIYSVDFHK